jgi:hypothetical protein
MVLIDLGVEHARSTVGTFYQSGPSSSIAATSEAKGAQVGCFPPCLGLPRTAVGSASTKSSSLWRPSQASRLLRPAGSLIRPMANFVTRLRPAGCPTEPLVSYQINRQFWAETTKSQGASRKIYAAIAVGGLPLNRNLLASPENPSNRASGTKREVPGECPRQFDSIRDVESPLRTIRWRV